LNGILVVVAGCLDEDVEGCLAGDVNAILVGPEFFLLIEAGLDGVADDVDLD
jgi:hypothetical protein